MIQEFPEELTSPYQYVRERGAVVAFALLAYVESSSRGTE